MYYLKLGAKEYPFLFGTLALDMWQKNESREDMSLSDIDDYLEKPIYQRQFIYYGLKAGAKIEKQEFPMTEDDVLVLLDQNPGAFMRAMGYVTMSFMQTHIGTDQEKAEAALQKYLNELNPDEEGKNVPSP